MHMLGVKDLAAGVQPLLAARTDVDLRGGEDRRMPLHRCAEGAIATAKALILADVAAANTSVALLQHMAAPWMPRLSTSPLEFGKSQ